MIAALYVETGGAYYGRDDIDPWDIDRDARTYDGPWPVIAHPPCATWCQLAPVNQKRWGKMIGDDHGTFAAALAAVRQWGGILEHPAYSYAWRRYRLPVPHRGGWTTALDDPGMTTELDQSAYGHPARKRTWLYAVGIDPAPLDWRHVTGTAVVGAGIHTGECAGRPRIDGAPASATPPGLRDLLVTLAATASP